MYHFNLKESIQSCSHFGALNLSYTLPSLSHLVLIFTWVKKAFEGEVPCLATQHRNNVPRLRGEKHDFSLKILHQAGFETARQVATLSKRHALAIAPCPSLRKYISFFCSIWTIISMYRIHHPNLATGRYLCCPPKVWASCASTSWQDRWRQVKKQTWFDQASYIILNSLHLNTEDTLTWAGFMASLLKNDRSNIKPNAIIGVMPLRQDSIYTMVKHTMNIGKCMTEFVNPR